MMKSWHGRALEHGLQEGGVAFGFGEGEPVAAEAQGVFEEGDLGVEFEVVGFGEEEEILVAGGDGGAHSAGVFAGEGAELGGLFKCG